MSRLIPLLTTLALAGCVVQPPNYVRYDSPAPDGVYSQRYAEAAARANAPDDNGAGADNGNRADDRYNGDASAANQRRDDPDRPDYAGPGDYADNDDSGYADIPDYIEYPAYYSSLWPVYGSYYYPYASPFFYPGVTFFPSGFYGVGYGGFGWGIGLSFGFGFSPWRSGFWDRYYDWGYWRHNYPNYAHYYPNPRYGGFRNASARYASNYYRGVAGRGNSLPSWDGQRAGSSTARMSASGAARNSSFAANAAAERNGLTTNGGRSNGSAGYASPRYGSERSMNGSATQPSASYRGQQGASSVSRYGNAGGARSSDYPATGASRSRYAGQSLPTGQRSAYASQYGYAHAGSYGYRGSTTSSAGGYLPHEYGARNVDHSAAPRGYMSGGGAQMHYAGPYGGPVTRGGGTSSRSSNGGAHAASASAHGGGHESGHSH